MVLSELGARISGALKSMTTKTVIDEEVVDAMLKEIGAALLSADVNVKIVVQLRKNIKQQVNLDNFAAGANKRRAIQRVVFDELCGLLDPETKPFVPKKAKPNVIMFVGLQGSGKTTTCTKYAYHWMRKGWKTCLVCADTFRAGAFDQLKQNAIKTRIPFYGSYVETDPVKLAVDGVEKFRAEGQEIIIVDTSGRHKQEAELFDEMQQIVDQIQPDDIVFVMDSSIGQAALDQAKAFKDAVPVGSVIMTKLDGHAKGGGALSAVAATRSPVIFIGTGEHMDCLEPFDTRSFVSRLLGMGDPAGFVKIIQEAGLDKNPELYQKLSQGEFTLRDMYDQFQNIMKMGPLSQVMSMIPQMSQMIPQGREHESQARLQMFLTVMDSMTDQELDHPKVSQLMSESRYKRIGQGSGHSSENVKQLLTESKRFQKMVGKMKHLKMGKNGEMPNLGRNPQQAMQQMSKCMDPRMLKQFGGAGGLQAMMKNLSKAGGAGMEGLF